MPLSANELEARLEAALDPVLSSRRTVGGAARVLSKLDEPAQRFVLHWLDVVCASNSELGYQFAALAGQALERLSLEDAESWIVNALDVYDLKGLFPATSALSDLEAFANERARSRYAVPLESQSALIQRYLRGLSGREMRVAAGDDAHTDTETIYLPRVLEKLPTTGQNRLLYKIMATHLWAMNRFGTFRRPTPDAPALAQRLAAFDEPELARRLFHSLETERLNACIGRELPGMRREVERLFPSRPSGEWKHAADDLSRPDAGVEDSLNWVRRFIERGWKIPAPAIYQGYADLEAAETLTQDRLADDRSELQQLIQDLIEQMDRDDVETGEDDDADITLDFDRDGPANDYRLTLGGKPVAIPVALRERLDSILQDLDGIPEDWLATDEAAGEQSDSTPTGELPQAPDTDPMFLYDEWDFQRGHYRKDWCILYERQVAPDNAVFFDATLRKHQGVVLDLRRAFELLRDQQHTLRRQPEGEDIDLDAVVEANTDHRLGREISNRLFLKTHRHERDIAVMFMVDLSGSTKGWIVDAEREALVLLCEALEVLGDRYGIYGFSGMTRKRCELFRIKRLNEPLDDPVKARIAGIMPRDYTRMGVTIRHLTKLMDGVDAKTRLLITLSDGKPDDYDGYRGEYGIEDTRQALIEARNKGIHSFCITIDKQAGEYLPHMYGAVNYTVVDDIRKLPGEVSRVYCRLTR